MRHTISLLMAGLLAVSPAFAIELKTETKAETKAEFETPQYVSPPEHHDGHAFVPQDFDHEVAVWDHEEPIFNQEEYIVTVKNQADMMVALEAMKKDLEQITLDLANIETNIYGNSNDSFDNFGDVDANQIDVGQNRHTFGGLVVRVHDLADKCRWNQSELDYNRDVLVLFCQQFAFAPDMVPACAPLLSCSERELHYDYGFNGQYHYTQPQPHIHHEAEPYPNHQPYHPDPTASGSQYLVNVHAGGNDYHHQSSSSTSSPSEVLDVHDLCKNGPVELAEDAHQAPTSVWSPDPKPSYYPEPTASNYHYDVNVQAGGNDYHHQSSPSTSSQVLDVHDLCKNGPVDLAEDAHGPPTGAWNPNA